MHRSGSPVSDSLPLTGTVETPAEMTEDRSVKYQHDLPESASTTLDLICSRGLAVQRFESGMPDLYLH